jgi:hypothetical protein
LPEHLSQACGQVVELRHLRYFVAAAEMENVLRATRITLSEHLMASISYRNSRQTRSDLPKARHQPVSNESNIGWPRRISRHYSLLRKDAIDHRRPTEE